MINYKLYFFVFLLIIIGKTEAQVPSIQWQKVYGGSNNDYAQNIQQTFEGGYIVAGYSFSNNFDITDHIGNADFWVVKLTNNGTIQWKKSFGGTSIDNAYSIKQTIDSGYIIAGTSLSTDYDIENNKGDFDAWVIKIDKNGFKQWAKNYGGSNKENAQKIIELPDGSYVFIGSTLSNNNDVSGNHGLYDMWVVKINSLGILNWQKTFGGTNNDFGEDIKLTFDKGFIISGESNSVNGNINNNHGNYDYWIAKLDSVGNLQWQNSYGGYDNENPYSISQTKDSGYIVAGDAASKTGDVFYNYGNYDFWLLKINKLGSIVWRKNYGGSNFDFAKSMAVTSDGGFAVLGYTYSADSNITSNHGDRDFWLLKINDTGRIEWQKSFGGSNADEAYSLQQSKDGGYVLAGSSSSFDGDLTQHYGTSSYFDYWVVKLSPDPLPINILNFNLLKTTEHIFINWKVINEINVSHYNVQRSVNAEDFETIGNLRLDSGDYIFYDKTYNKLKYENLFYRIEIFNKNGSKNYSDIKQIKLLNTNNLNIFPNPAIGQVTIECDNIKELQIIDFNGKIIKQSNNNNLKSQLINTSQFKKGVYLIKVILYNQQVEIRKLVLE